MPSVLVIVRIAISVTHRGAIAGEEERILGVQCGWSGEQGDAGEQKVRVNAHSTELLEEALQDRKLNCQFHLCSTDQIRSGRFGRKVIR